MALGCCNDGGCPTACYTRRQAIACSPFGLSNDSAWLADLQNLYSQCPPPFDTTYSYSNGEIDTNASPGTTAYIDCTSTNRYYTVTIKYTKIGRFGGSYETRWAQTTYTRDTRDGRITSFVQTTSESGTTFSYALDDYGTVTQSGTVNNQSGDIARDSCASESGDTYSSTVTATTAEFFHEWACDSWSGETWSDKCEITLTNALSEASSWAQAAAHLDAVNLDSLSEEHTAVVSNWSSGPLTASETGTRSIGEVLGSSGAGWVYVGYARHEDDGMIRVVAGISGVTHRVGYGSGITYATNTAQKAEFVDGIQGWTNTGSAVTSLEWSENYFSPSAGSSEWLNGSKSAVYRTTGDVHLAHFETPDTACDSDTASGTNQECDFGLQDKWVLVDHSDVYYDHGYCRITKKTTDPACGLIGNNTCT